MDEGFRWYRDSSKLREIDSKSLVVIMSGHGTIETAVKATKIGAFDYLEKPFRWIKFSLLEHAKSIAKFTEDKMTSGPTFIGESKPIQIVKKQINLVSGKNAWILISGENGTGKEELAKSIHSASTRNGKPFVVLSCSSEDSELLDKELFGDSAYPEKISKFELANNGTLFIDEVANLSLKSQAALVKYLEEKIVVNNATGKELELDVRVIAATNKNLKVNVSKGKFREDLYFKLTVIPFHLNPLRERGSDIQLLADYFLDGMSEH